MVVRSSVIDTATWDARPKRLQENTIGRFKYSGASLDLADDPVQLHDDPRFAAVPGNETVPVTAHVRKANPRTSEADKLRRIFRRGYPFDRRRADGGEARPGLHRLRTDDHHPVRVHPTRLDYQPGLPATQRRGCVQDFETVRCGGYFFVPAIKDKRKPWDWVLPAPLDER